MNKQDLLEKWLSGSLTDKELEVFKNSDEYLLNNEIIEGAQYFKASNFSKAKSFENFKKDMNVSNKSKVISFSSYKFIAKIAAIFILTFGTYFAYQNLNMTSVQSLASQKTEFELPDASVVILNATSKIKFNENNWNKNRQLNLTGEAFFKVAKGSKFDVKTTQGTVSVLGTQFTVKQRDNYFEVKCFEGIVSVAINKETYKLTVGKTLRLLNNSLTLNTTEQNNPEWLNNITSFESVPVSEVIGELERQYGLSILTQDINDKRIFTGGFVHDNLEQALNSILVPLELDYKKDSENKIIIHKK